MKKNLKVAIKKKVVARPVTNKKKLPDYLDRYDYEELISCRKNNLTTCNSARIKKEIEKADKYLEKKNRIKEEFLTNKEKIQIKKRKEQITDLKKQLKKIQSSSFKINQIVLSKHLGVCEIADIKLNRKGELLFEITDMLSNWHKVPKEEILSLTETALAIYGD